MHTTWSDIDARVRGLVTHFPDDRQITEWAELPSLGRLAHVLAASGIIAGELSATTAEGIEVAARRWAARQVAIVSRWASQRVDALAVFLEDEDRRSIRAMVRGASQGVESSSRIAGLIPTPSLDNRSLEELARCTTPRQVAAILMAWGNAYGPTVLAATRGIQPDLLAFEIGLARTYFERSRSAAEHDALLTRYVKQLIDVANVCTALALRGHADTSNHELFIEGGTIPVTTLKSGSQSRSAFRDLHHELRNTWLADIAERSHTSRTSLERDIVAEQLRQFRQVARLNPLSAAPVIVFFLRLRSVVSEINRLSWRLMLNVPRLPPTSNGSVA